MEDDEFVPIITVNVEALKEEAYQKGFKDGYDKRKEDSFREVYMELRNDICERLRTIMSTSNKDFSECLDEIEKMR